METLERGWRRLVQLARKECAQVGLHCFTTPLVSRYDDGAVYVFRITADGSRWEADGWMFDLPPDIRPTTLLAVWRELEAVRMVARTVGEYIADLQEARGTFTLGPVTVKAYATGVTSEFAVANPLADTVNQVLAAIWRDAAAARPQINAEKAALEQLLELASAYVLGGEDE